METGDQHRTEKDKVQPHEWFIVLVRSQNVSYFGIYEKFQRLFHEVEESYLVDAETNNLFWSATEWISGISSSDTDLRLADRLARRGARPTLVFVAIRQRYSVQKRDDEFPGDAPSDRYIDEVIYRVYLQLYVEALASGRATPITEERLEELHSLLAADGEADADED